ARHQSRSKHPLRANRLTVSGRPSPSSPERQQAVAMGSVLVQQRSCAIRLHGSPVLRQLREPSSETRSSALSHRLPSPLRESERSFPPPCRRSGLSNVHLLQLSQRERGSGLRRRSSRAALCCSQMSRLPGVH